MPGKIKFLENDSQFEDEKLGLKIAERLELVTRAYASFSGTGNRFKNPRKNNTILIISPKRAQLPKRFSLKNNRRRN